VLIIGMGEDVDLVGVAEEDEVTLGLEGEDKALGLLGEIGGLLGGGGVVRKAATVWETWVCSLDRGRDVSPITNPPSAWHACVRSPRVGASSEESTEGRIVVANVGTKMAG
jgi:hypothetical protein